MIAQPKIRHGIGGISTASWSPDGSRLAYWTFWGVEGVFILDLASGQTTCVAGCKTGGLAIGWIPAWPRWLDDHTLFVEAYLGPPLRSPPAADAVASCGPSPSAHPAAECQTRRLAVDVVKMDLGQVPS